MNMNPKSNFNFKEKIKIMENLNLEVPETISQDIPKNTQNTPKLTLINDSILILTSNLKLEDIKKLEKTDKGALTLAETDSDGYETELFKIATGPAGNITKYGITFDSQNKDGYACATIILPKLENITTKEYIKTELYSVFLYLTRLENMLKDYLEEVDEILNNIIVEEIEA